MTLLTLTTIRAVTGARVTNDALAYVPRVLIRARCQVTAIINAQRTFITIDSAVPQVTVHVCSKWMLTPTAECKDISVTGCHCHAFTTTERWVKSVFAHGSVHGLDCQGVGVVSADPHPLLDVEIEGPHIFQRS